MAEAPEARSGLPRAIERRLMRRYADGLGRRIGAAAALRALGVLVRRHPGATLDALGAGIAHAARVGMAEAREKLAAPKARPQGHAGPEQELPTADAGEAASAGEEKSAPPPSPSVETTGTGAPPRLDRQRLRRLIDVLESRDEREARD